MNHEQIYLALEGKEGNSYFSYFLWNGYDRQTLLRAWVMIPVNSESGDDVKVNDKNKHISLS